MTYELGKITQQLEAIYTLLKQSATDALQEYDYMQTWRVEKDEEWESGGVPSVETLRTQGWKVHSAYGTTDGDLYHILRRPRDYVTPAD